MRTYRMSKATLRAARLLLKAADELGNMIAPEGAVGEAPRETYSLDELRDLGGRAADVEAKGAWLGAQIGEAIGEHCRPEGGFRLVRFDGVRGVTRPVDVV